MKMKVMNVRVKKMMGDEVRGRRDEISERVSEGVGGMRDEIMERLSDERKEEMRSWMRNDMRGK